jgi:regulator of sigma E protease
MSFLSDFSLWSVLTWVVPFLVVLGVVVFVHEMGHFLVARYFGVTVEAFSIGFGPEIFAFMDRKNTRWRLAAIPLGGYVKFKGDDNAASIPSREDLSRLSDEERRGNFHAKPVAQRAAVVAAGPIANFILAIVILTFWFMFVGKAILEPRVETIEPGSAAEAAGIKPGDLIVGVGGSRVQSFDEVQRVVMLSAGTELEVVVQRGNQEIPLKATPRLKETTDRFGNSVKIGLLGIARPTRREDVTMHTYGPLNAFSMSLSETWFWIKQPIAFIQRLATGQASSEELGGPIRIAQLSKEVASVSVIELFRWIAIISINIGLMNLFPIPLLDGGHLLFYGIEAIRGRPLSERTLEIGFRIGFALVIMLMIFATRNDVIHLLRRIG